MMQDTEKLRYQIVGFVIGCTITLAGMAVGVSAQTNNEPDASGTKRVRDAGRDPFRRYELPRAIVKKSGVVGIPSIKERVEQYRAQKAAAMAARMPAPKPTTAFLLDEIQVVGITRTPRGYAAIVEATPIKLSYVVYPGEKFYNGQLVAIEDNRLVFRRETVFYDGRRDKTMELKPLRAPTSVNAMSAAKTASAETPENEKRADDKNASEKP
ncbi:MAG TPA: hypothetical protein VIV66_23440 [Pyrinomonadaceae bacterium]